MSVINKVSQTVRGTHINTVKDKQLDFFFLFLWLAELDLFHIAPDETIAAYLWIRSLMLMCEMQNQKASQILLKLYVCNTFFFPW